MVLHQQCNLQSTQMVQEAAAPSLPPHGQIQLQGMCVCEGGVILSILAPGLPETICSW